MANLIIKPASGGSLKLQEDGGTDAISISPTGVSTITNAAITAWTPPAGTVLQVLSATKTDTFSQSTTLQWTDITGLSVAITPSATSSKIWVSGVTYIGNLSGDPMTRIMRGSTAICIGNADGNRTRITTGGSVRNTYELVAQPYNFLDSPSTTSATTYKMQIYVGATSYVNRSNDDANNTNAERTASTITVMEIKG